MIDLRAIVGICKYNGFRVLFDSAAEAGRNGFEASHISRNLNKKGIYEQKGYIFHRATSLEIVELGNRKFSKIDIDRNKDIYLSEFKKIPGYPNYLINKEGLVYSKKADKLKSTNKGKQGYLHLAMVNESGESKNFDLHRLVALTFIPNPNNLPQVNHKDENKINNNVNNLEWCTASQNINYGTRNERVSQKLKMQYNPLTEAVQLPVEGE